jgi:hypothetical protein
MKYRLIKYSKDGEWPLIGQGPRIVEYDSLEEAQKEADRRNAEIYWSSLRIKVIEYEEKNELLE